MEHDDFENAWNYILEAIERYEHGFIQCCNCGKWIKFEKAQHTCPAGCYCVECYAEGLKAEKDYFSYPDSFSSGPGPR